MVGNSTETVTTTAPLFQALIGNEKEGEVIHVHIYKYLDFILFGMALLFCVPKYIIWKRASKPLRDLLQGN